MEEKGVLQSVGSEELTQLSNCTTAIATKWLYTLYLVSLQAVRTGLDGKTRKDTAHGMVDIHAVLCQ